MHAGQKLILSYLAHFSFVSDIAVFIKGFTLYIMVQQGSRRRNDLEKRFTVNNFDYTLLNNISRLKNVILF